MQNHKCGKKDLADGMIVAPVAATVAGAAGITAGIDLFAWMGVILAGIVSGFHVARGLFLLSPHAHLATPTKPWEDRVVMEIILFAAVGLGVLILVAYPPLYANLPSAVALAWKFCGSAALGIALFYFRLALEIEVQKRSE